MNNVSFAEKNLQEPEQLV